MTWCGSIADNVSMPVTTRAVLVAFALAAALALAACGGTAGTQGAAEPAATGHGATSLPAQDLRVVFVFPGEASGVSESATVLRAGVVEGVPPSAVTVATVLTDEDCAPDAQGISHCLNELRLPDGTVLTVRHPHDMSKVPCLTPGEQVELRPAA